MNAEVEPAKDASTVADVGLDGSPESWRPVIEANRLHEPGVVVLLIGEHGLDAAHVAAWHVAIAALGEDECSPAYRRFRHFVLPQEAHAFADLPAEVARLVGTGPKPSLETEGLSSSEIAALDKAFRAMPERSAGSFVGLERIRSADVTLPHGVEVEHWEGGTRSLRTEDELHAAHVAAAVRKLVPIAKERSLLLLIAARLSGAAIPMLREHVEHLDGLAILSAPPTFHELAAAKIMRLAREIRTGETALTDALSALDIALSEPEQRALARSQLLYSEQHFATAWREIEPFTKFWLADVHTQSAALFLQLGQTAFAAQRRDPAAKFLAAALQVAPTSFEDLQTALRLARSLDDQTNADAVLDQMQAHFPTDPVTLRLLHERALRQWDYATAEKLSLQLGEPADARLWSALARTDLEVDDLLTSAEANGRRGRILACAAREALRRGDVTQADHWAAMVERSAPEFAAAVEIRLRVFRDAVLSKRQIENSDVADFLPLLEAVASLHENTQLRTRFEDLLEKEVPEATATHLLIASTWQLLPQVLKEAYRAPCWMFDVPQSTDASFREDLTFLIEVMKSLEPPLVAIGRGELVEHLRSDATPARLRSLMRDIQMIPLTADDSTTPTLLLSAVEKIARIAHDPSADVLIAELLITRQARAAGLQPARNLAEETLRVLPTTQPEYAQWRLALAWYAFGEAFSVTGNPVAALRHAALALTVMRHQVIEAEPVCYLLRLITKCVRDLHHPRLALECIDLERSLRKRIGATAVLYQLEQVQISVEGALLPSAAPRHLMRFLRRTLRLWRSLPEEAENLPALSMAVSFLREVRWAGVEVADALRQEVVAALTTEGGPYAQLLTATARGQITRDELLEFVQTFDTAVRADDLATQLRPLKLVAEDALDAAVSNNDAALFLTAVSIFSQPVLSASVAAPPVGMRDIDAEKLRRWALRMAGSADTDLAVLRDINDLLTDAGQPSTITFSKACAVGPRDVAEVISPEESVLFLAEGPDDCLRLCLVRSDGGVRLQRLDQSVWSAQQLAKWQRKFPAGLVSTQSFSGRGWTTVELGKVMSGLCLPLISGTKQLTLVPSAQLFEFAFALCDTGRFAADAENTDGVEEPLVRWTPGGELLGRAFRLAIAPSAAWLIHARTNAPAVESRWKAWLGSPSSIDPAVIALRKHLVPLFSSRNVTLIEAETPENMAGSALAIIGSHGQREASGQFRAISDGRTSYSTAEMAEHLRGCGCVVLCVCHGGGSNVAVSTNEIRGMVGALLSNGVHAVIAAAWPISVGTAAYWMPIFLDRVRAGENVRNASYTAAKSVEVHSSDAAAPAAFQVYGDGLYASPVA